MAVVNNDTIIQKPTADGCRPRAGGGADPPRARTRPEPGLDARRRPGRQEGLCGAVPTTPCSRFHPTSPRQSCRRGDDDPFHRAPKASSSNETASTKIPYISEMIDPLRGGRVVPGQPDHPGIPVQRLHRLQPDRVVEPEGGLERRAARRRHRSSCRPVPPSSTPVPAPWPGAWTRWPPVPTELQSGTASVSSGSAEVASGASELAQGARKLHSGADKLARSSRKLANRGSDFAVRTRQVARGSDRGRPAVRLACPPARAASRTPWAISAGSVPRRAARCPSAQRLDRRARPGPRPRGGARASSPGPPEEWHAPTTPWPPGPGALADGERDVAEGAASLDRASGKLSTSASKLASGARSVAGGAASVELGHRLARRRHPEDGHRRCRRSPRAART